MNKQLFFTLIVTSIFATHTYTSDSQTPSKSPTIERILTSRKNPDTISNDDIIKTVQKRKKEEAPSEIHCLLKI